MLNWAKIKVGGAVTLAVLSSALVLHTAYAIFSDNKSNEVDVKTGDVVISLEEDAPFTDSDQLVNGYSAKKKTFRVASNGSKRTYVRAAIFPSIEYYDSDLETWAVLGALSNKDLAYTITDATKENWIESDDGYFYYKNVLTEGQKTSDFVIDGIQLGTVPIEYKDLTIRVNFYIETEGIQATHQSYKINWDLENLPEQVEKVPSYNDDAELDYIPSFPDDPVVDASGHKIS